MLDDCKFLELEGVYLAHPDQLLNYTFQIGSGVEAHVIAQILKAGPVGKLPIPPKVYPDTEEPSSERSQCEISRGATPIKKAAQAASQVSGASSGVAGGGIYGGVADPFEPLALELSLFDATILDEMAANADKHILSPAMIREWTEVTSPAPERELRKIHKS